MGSRLAADGARFIKFSGQFAVHLRAQAGAAVPVTIERSQMQRSDFSYQLPDELIARYPTEQRDGSRLLVADGAAQTIAHRQFTDILDELQAGDLLVFNDTRVIPARLFGRKASGGRIEVLIERVLSADRALAHVRSSRSPKAGARLQITADEHSESVCAELEMLGREGALFDLKAVDGDLLSLLNRVGHMPLPPYIDRADTETDQERYQTVYAKQDGAVAAPTAGLHFTEQLLQQSLDKGVEHAFVTLHVGAGTFQPVKVDNILEHPMHSESIVVNERVCEQVRATRERGGRVIAVGTTSVRSLETASASGELCPFTGESQLFIYPGYRFHSVDAMITNFHLPESTLLMLVSAFCGREFMLEAYQAAIDERYRFFSYGDAMFLKPQRSALAKEGA